MEMQNGPHIALPQNLFLVGVGEDHEDAPGQAGAGLDDVGQEPLLGLLVEVLLLVAGKLLVPAQVVVAPAVDALEFLPPPWGTKNSMSKALMA